MFIAFAIICKEVVCNKHTWYTVRHCESKLQAVCELCCISLCYIWYFFSIFAVMASLLTIVGKMEYQ